MELSTGRKICGGIGIVLGAVSFLFQGTTFYKIYKNKAVENDFELYPYFLTVLGCASWVFYGMPFVHPNSELILGVNCLGIVCEMLYIGIYFKYTTAATNTQWKKIRAAYVCAEIVAFGILVWRTMSLDDGKKLKVSGILCDICGLLTYVSPFLNMKKVIKTGSVEHMPLVPSIINILNGVCWMIYAFLPPLDPYVLAINSFGALCGVGQVFVYYWCYNGNHILIPIPMETELATFLTKF